MAGDWIKTTHALPGKPEVWAIAEELGIDPDAVVGKLIRVWIYFDTQSEKGNVPSVTRALLDRDVGRDGFIKAMENVGWIKESRGVLTVVNFDFHISKTAKTRALGAIRSARQRAKTPTTSTTTKNSNADTVTGSVTSPLPEKRRGREENISNKEKESKKKKTVARRTRLPTDWKLTQKLREYCQEKRPDLDPDYVAEGFKLYWWSDGRVKADWDLTFMNWVRNQQVSYGNKQKPETAVQTRERRNREALERAETEGDDCSMA